jgi:predicted nucleotidyltransferase
MVKTSEEVKRIIRHEYPYLRNHFGIKRIGLFGSFASRRCLRESDVDLVVEFDRPIGFKFMALAEYMENKLGRKVDLLTPDGIETIRSKRIAQDIKKSIIYV